MRELEIDKTSIRADFDSLKMLCDSSLTFVFTIAPKEENKNIDIVKTGVGSIGEFNEKVDKLNFRMKEDFYLEVGEQKYCPALVTMENDYGITSGRNFIIVFDLEGETQSSWIENKVFSLVYEDQVFRSGVINFKFDNIDSVPTIKL